VSASAVGRDVTIGWRARGSPSRMRDAVGQAAVDVTLSQSTRARAKNTATRFLSSEAESGLLLL
jgi:hypothetical protein